ncbi:hypothetical protein CNYM01_13066 [Colletotrichum nymphaeae SA-01]|uniref:CorA-like Mg2+ transporter n=1 Tax=Colletotrichum nymphaeae SA-01 TaxID=1460502 RepID=A0A135RRK1_9PEZI|nr:hypothetical protein CNYM01_13066 [Colletotrichum nymphaeae SA-01]
MAIPHSEEPFGPVAEAASKGRARESFFSFGDEGLTASVGATGRLLRITQQFAEQKTGICVDDECTQEPYYTSSRLDEFLLCSQHEEMGGVGPRIDFLCPGREVEHNIVNDRWPTFTKEIPGGTSRKLRVSYVAFQGTVYQKFQVIDTRQNRTVTKAAVDDKWYYALGLSLRVLIRDLDFVNEDNHFNKLTSNSPGNSPGGVYETDLVGVENHIIRKHKSHDRHFVLHVQVLDQHSMLKFRQLDQGPVHHVRRNHNDSDHPVSEVVLAYTLKQGSAASEIKPVLPNWNIFLQANALLEPLPTLELAKDETFDFIFRRNLEYTLSVCSIPVSEADCQGIPAIALTCGDVDGHRVTNAASFYAFQLLLLGLDRLKTLHSEQPALCTCDSDKKALSFTASPVCMMKWRIERVCKGHLKWVFQRAVSLKKSSMPFSPNYWTNGDEIDDWESSQWLPGRSLVDAPFQFIKAADFYERTEKKMPEELLTAAAIAYHNWIYHLDKLEKSRKYAFPSYKASKDGKATKTFYLTDHALIWQALRSAELLNLPFGLVSDPEKMRRYSAERLRENIIKNFTTENPVLKKKMIAVERNPTQTRFLFRSEDIGLFRAMEEGLFDKADTQWANTLDCQKYYEENDHTDRSDPRMSALAITMAQTESRISYRPRRKVIEQHLSILFRSSSFNGLLAGKLDDRQDPAIYEDERERDVYWTIVFEVPCILWKEYCLRRFEDIDDGIARTPISTESLRFEPMYQSDGGVSNHSGDLTLHAARPTGPKYHYNYWTKVGLPFNNVIDDNNIVELQDEWLYNEPEFFVGSTTVGFELNLNAGISKKNRPNTFVKSTDVRLMIDVPEHKPLKEKRPLGNLPVTYFSNDSDTEFQAVTGSRRQAKYSKRRFWAFVSRKAEQNESCINTFAPNEGREKSDTGWFLQRHISGSNFFIEETTAALNKWTTEFHVAFSSVSDVSKNAGVARLTWTSGKVAMGFRIEGDFFNRYWTCRFLTADPQLQAEDEVRRDLIGLLEQTDTAMVQNHTEVKTGSWKQRRVLELMLFGRVIKRINLSARGILELAENDVKEHTDKLERRLQRLQNPKREREFSTSTEFKLDRPASTPDEPIDYKSFLITSYNFRKFHAELQTIHGDLKKVRSTIDQWLNRENDRQAERPRWTYHDESRYRSMLNKLLAANQQGIQELEQNLVQISSLADSITQELEYVRGRLDIMASDRSQRNDEAIRLFTYITAIFLPLGFATGMFSMSGTPDAQTVGRMFGLFGGVFLVGLLIILLVTKVNVNFTARIRGVWEELIGRDRAWPSEDHENALWETRSNNRRSTG